MGKARFAVHRAGGILVVRVRGLLDLASANRLRASSIDDINDRPAAKVLVDVRAAIIVMDAQEVQEFGEGPAIEAPVGVLLDPSQRKLLRNYTRAMEMRGHIRPIFTALDDALRWTEMPALGLPHLPQFHPRSLAY